MGLLGWHGHAKHGYADFCIPRTTSMDNNGYRKLRRHNVPGTARELTFSCFKNQPFLLSDRARRWFVEAMTRSQDLHRFDLWAWVLMPTHVHLLLLPDPARPVVGPILTSIKLPVAKKAVYWCREHRVEGLNKMADVNPQGEVVYRFWQRGAGYDRCLYEPKAIWNAIEYIHQNPVRAGLCSRAEEWEWSSVCAMSGAGHNARIPLALKRLPARPA